MSETFKYFSTCGVVSVLCVVKLCLMDVKCIIVVHLVLYYYLKLLEVQLNERDRIDTWQYIYTKIWKETPFVAKDN